MIICVLLAWVYCIFFDYLLSKFCFLSTSQEIGGKSYYLFSVELDVKPELSR